MKLLGISAAIVGGSAYLLRRRISKNWIDFRKENKDLTDKVIVITGGNTGLGFEVAKDFARRNATVVIACRNLEKGSEAIRSILLDTGNGNVECMELDLASLASVRNFIAEVKNKYSSINALVCNAGIWVPEAKNDESEPREYQSKDGYEIQFHVNHLSHFLLARSLVENLEKSEDGRIVFVSSSLLKSGLIDFEKFDHVYQGRKSAGEGQNNSHAPPPYCDTKLMNAVTCRQLSTKLPVSVTTYAVCPGFCRSSLGRHVSLPLAVKVLATPVMHLIQRTSLQGAQGIIFATLEEKSKLKSGQVYKDGMIDKETNEFVDSLGASVASKLFEISTQLLEDAPK